MSRVLVVSEIRDHQLKSINFEAYSAAHKIAEQLNLNLTTILLGKGIEDLAQIPAKYGVKEVYLVDDPRLEKFSADQYAKVIAEAAGKLDARMVFMGASSMGKDLLPRVAHLLNSTLAQDVVEFGFEGQSVWFKRPMYAGKVLATLRLTSPVILATFRPKIFRPEENPVQSNVTRLTPDIPEPLAVVEALETSGGGELDVTEADIIVSGGRGMKGPENWKLIDELADVLGAAKGASRAVVDAGWREHGEQIGQTGKTVSPTLYIACGISGAIQHLAGMSSSKYIVAINKDPDAPIFKVADYGIVGDVFEVLPRLTEEIRKIKEGDA